MKQNDKYREYITYAYSMDEAEDDIAFPDEDKRSLLGYKDEFEETGSGMEEEAEVLLEEVDIGKEFVSLGEELKETDPVRLYMNEIGRIPLLTKEEEKNLAKQAAEGNEAAKEKLVQSNLRYVVYVAKNYKNKGMAFLDLIQEGNWGLIEAVERFDYTRDLRLCTYAKHWIKKYILKALKDTFDHDAVSLNQEIGEDGSVELQSILYDYGDPSVEELAINHQISLDVSEIGEYLKKLSCNDPKDKLVLHIITNEFHEKSINTLLKKADMTRKEFEERKGLLYSKAKKLLGQGGYYREERDEEELELYRKELESLSAGYTTKLEEKLSKSVRDLADPGNKYIDTPAKCWEMDPASFFGSDREARFLKKVEGIKSVECSKYVFAYLSRKYNTKDKELCLKYLKKDYKKYGISVSKPKDYFDGLFHHLNEAKLNDMALATHMSIREYSVFRKKVIKCTEADFTSKEYIFMYFVLRYAAACGIFNYKEAYSILSGLYKEPSVEESVDFVLENIYDASRIIGNEILYHIEQDEKFKTEYLEQLFVKSIPKLSKIIKKAEAIEKKHAISSSEELFHNQWKELRENIVQYDGNEIEYEYNLINAYREGKIFFEVTSKVDIDRPYIRRTLYGVMEPDKEDVCQIGSPDSFLNSEDYLNTLIYDNNIITTFAKKPAKTKRNLLLTLLFANYCYKLLNATMIGDEYEERLAYFEDKVYREFSACGYMALNNENAYDVFLKLVLTCGQPLELYRYLWLKKLNQPLWDYCIDDPQRYMEYAGKKRRMKNMAEDTSTM